MYGVIIAFKRYSVFKGYMGSPWAEQWGFEHFIDFFTSPDAGLVIRNTVTIALLKLALLSLPPVILAMLLNEIRIPGFKRSIQTLSYLPYFIAWVVLGGMIRTILDVNFGPLNVFLIRLGITDEPIFFLANKRLFWPILILSDLWKNVGWSSIIYLGVIATIDPSLYESAAMDGAGRLRQAYHITWPHLLHIFMILFIIACGNIMQGMGGTFQQCYILGNELTRDVSDIIDTYVLRIGLEQGRFSFATAVGFFKSVVNLALLLLANTLSKRLTNKGLF
jgi:putative aldouronate transport system permease protein